MSMQDVIERIEELNKKRKWLFEIFAPNHEINQVEVEIYTLLWVINE